jgi:hypothetical protein
MEWPGGDQSGGEGGSLEELDEQLDEALGDFDESMGEGASGGEEEIDILNPMSSGGGASSQSNEPYFEEGESGDGDGSYEDEGIAQRAEAGASGGESGSSGSEGEQGGSSSSGGGGGGAAPEGSQSASSASGSEDSGESDVVPIPDDVGDGRDDDIVLRQIREAAMKERDPVLREKLWDEYRRIRDQR